MSLLCPRCGVLLNEVRKVGVVVDICDQCRGMWLDRGEMEKIVQELRSLEREEGRLERRPEERPYREPERYRHERDDDDDDYGRRKKSGWGRLMELFD
ncbi:MAG: zf-TFIIB domain-containing protein [Candidatus Methylomirabilales bacterium]